MSKGTACELCPVSFLVSSTLIFIIAGSRSSHAFLSCLVCAGCEILGLTRGERLADGGFIDPLSVGDVGRPAFRMDGLLNDTVIS